MVRFEHQRYLIQPARQSDCIRHSLHWLGLAQANRNRPLEPLVILLPLARQRWPLLELQIAGCGQTDLGLLPPSVPVFTANIQFCLG